MVYDQSQSPRLGQRVPVESTFVQVFDTDPSNDLPDLPDVAYPGQLIFNNTRGILQIWDEFGDATTDNQPGWLDVAGGLAGHHTYVGETMPTGTAFNLSDTWYQTPNYTQYTWTGTQPWQPTGVVADGVTSGTFSDDIQLGAGLITPYGPNGEHVVLDSTGLTVYTGPDASDASTVLSTDQDPLEQLNGAAQISALTVTDQTTLRQKDPTVPNQLSRGSLLQLNQGVTSPSNAPTAVQDYRTIVLSGYDLSTWTLLDLTWDATTSHWWVAMTGGGGSQIVAYDNTGTYVGVVGGVQPVVTTSCVSGLRVPGIGNYFLFGWDSSTLALFGRNDSGAVLPAGFYWPHSTGAVFSMAYDGTYLCIGELVQVAGSPTIQIQKFNPTTSAGSNLVANGTFDTNLNHWSIASMPGAPTMSRITGGNVITGAGSMQVNFIGDLGSGPASDTFSVIARQRYVISADIKAISGSGASGKAVDFGIQFLDSGGGIINTDQVQQNVSTTVQTWTSTFQAPPNATQALVYVVLPNGPGNLVVDNVSCTRAPGMNFVSLETLSVSSVQSSPVNALYYGNGDFGSATWVVGSNSGGGINNAIVIPDSAGAETMNQTFPLAQTVIGIGYDGTSFWSLASNARLQRYEGGNAFTTQPASWYAASSFQDTANSYETGLSKYISFTMKRRARLTINATPINSTGTGDPNAVGFYLARKTSAPSSSTDWWYQGNATTNSLVLTASNFASSHPPFYSTAFPTATNSAELASAKADGAGPLIQFWGDGHWRLGTISGDTAGNVSGVGGGGTSGAPPNVQLFTANGTWTKPSGAVWVEVECIGGGGSGAGAGNPTSGNVSVGTGGGGGAYVRRIYDATTLAATQAVVVGQGGNAPSAGNNPGNNGTSSTFAGLSAGGGQGGNNLSSVSNNVTSGGNGGTASGGQINVPGMAGERGRVQANTSDIPIMGSSMGGGSVFGSPSESAGSANGSNGVNGTAYGAGGSGALNRQNTSGGPFAGGAGADGMVLVVTYFGGAQGPAGAGVPVGGTTNQMLVKNSNTDLDTKWVTGPVGTAGGDLTGSYPNPSLVSTTFNFASAATTWTCTHNLGKLGVKVFTTDLSGTEQRGDVQHTSINVVTITWVSATTGVAYITP